MRSLLSLRRLVAVIALAAAVLMAGSGCSVWRGIKNYYAEDRAYLSDEQYAVAREMFVQTGSLDLVNQRLIALQWLRAERNEAAYRLQKEFEVLPEELPTQPAK